MRPDISEFSYGYALTEQLVRDFGPGKAAPRFPSLIKEGSLGYDLKLETPVRGSLFLQFKLSDRMIRKSVPEIRKYGLFPPGTEFFRMHLRPRRSSMQHDLLCGLAAKGERVYYAAPEFDTPADLDEAYRTKSVMQKSAFFAPLEIGRLAGTEPHHVSFLPGEAFGWLFSEPVKVRRFASEIDALMPAEAGSVRPLEEELSRITNSMSSVLQRAGQRIASISSWDVPPPRPFFELPALRAVYMARVFFNCELILVGNTPRVEQANPTQALPDDAME